MGALHEGHLALVRRAREENASVIASIFVNPLQFGPGEDYEKYPRAFARDVELLEAAGVDLLYSPAVERMYRPGFSTAIDVGALGTAFEGAARPGHFRGVATVVAKLLNALEPTSLYLGQKDVQQTAVLRTMVRDLDLPTNIVVAATVREPDGLALSSRNAYLTVTQRRAAPSIYRAISAVAAAVADGITNPAVARAAGEGLLEAPLVWEYLSIVDPQTFEAMETIARPALVVAVARAGGTRLLDNLPIAAPGAPDPVLRPERPLRRAAVTRGLP